MPEQEARDRRSCIRDAGKIREEAAESERAGWRWWLDDVQTLPAEVGTEFHRVPALQPRQRIGNLRHAGAEVGGCVRRRTELLVAGNQKARKRIRKTGRRWNAGNVKNLRRRAAQLGREPGDGPSRIADPKLVDEGGRDRPLVTGCKRPRRRVLRSERAGGDAASFRQRCYRNERFAKARQATEHVVPVGGESVIDSRAELILIDLFIGNPSIVVGHACACRQGISLQQFDGDRVYSLRRNGISGELVPSRPAASDGRRCRRIVNDGDAPADGLGEDALSLQDCWDGRDHGSADRLPLPLVVGEKEGSILPNRTSDDTAKLIPTKPGLDRIRGGEVVPGIQCFVSEEFECGAVKSVAPGPGRQVDDAAVEAPELGWRTVALDFELLNGVDIWKEGDLARFGLQDRDAVEQILVGARPSAIDSWQRRARGKSDTRRQSCERDEAPAVQRQADDLAVVDDLAKP